MTIKLDNNGITLDSSQLQVVNGIVKADAVGALTAATALPDGTTATTQTPGDSTTKIATTAYVDTTIPGLPGVLVLNRDVTQNTVGDTAVETNIYSYTVAGGKLGISNRLRLQLNGTSNNQSGSSKELVFRVKYGATTLTLGTWTAVNAQIDHWGIDVYLTAKNATNAQSLFTNIFICRNDGDFGNGSNSTKGNFAVAEDSTANKDLVVSADWSAAPGVNPSITMETAFLELLA